jgi:hypothetical protein
MVTIRRIIFLLAVSCSFIALACGQSAIPATGGSATGSGGTVTYTIGQFTYHSYSDGNKSVTQGIQQPYEISVVTAIENTEGITLDFKIYPNPTRDFIILTIKPFDDDRLLYRLYDFNGILLTEKKIDAGMTEIPMVAFYPSIYFLRIFKDNQVVKVFKIIKN